MTKDNMVELKPCPFCGGEAKFTRDLNAIGCTNCWAEGPVTTPEGIAGEWNTRATMHGSDSGVTEAMIEAGRAAIQPGMNETEKLRASYLAMSSASAPDSGALREVLVEARAYVSAHHLPGEIFETELLAKIDAALANTDLSGER